MQTEPKTLRDTALARPAADFAPGSLIGGRFAVAGKIGEGGMGAVYLAKDTRLRRDVAVKVISGDAGETARRRFLREAQLMAGVRSASIVQIHDCGVDAASGSHYFVMDAHLLSPGEVAAVCQDRLRCPPPVAAPASAGPRGLRPLTLADVLSGSRALHEETAAALALEILGALRAIHGHDPAIVHRDVKPSNLLFTRGGDLLLADFGIAKPHPGGAGGRLHPHPRRNRARHVALRLARAKAGGGRHGGERLLLLRPRRLPNADGRPPGLGVHRPALGRRGARLPAVEPPPRPPARPRPRRPPGGLRRR